MDLKMAGRTWFMVAIVCLALAGGAAGKSKKAAGKVVSPGMWGGKHARLDVTPTGGSLDFDCAHGKLKEPLRVDAQGRFRAKGTYTQERPGPTRVDDTDTTRDVEYSGSIEGETMRLEIAVPGQSELMSFELVRDQMGRMIKCR